MKYIKSEVVEKAIANGVLVPYRLEGWSWKENETVFDYADGFYGDLRVPKDGDQNVAVISATEHSDYSGGTVEQSNYQVLEEMHEELGKDSPFVFLFGGHGTKCVCIRLYQEARDEVLDVINGLCDYPLIDEQKHAELENERLAEDWDSYGYEVIQLPEPETEEEEDEFAYLERLLIEKCYPWELQNDGMICYGEESGGHYHFRSDAGPVDWLVYARELAEEVKEHEERMRGQTFLYDKEEK